MDDNVIITLTEGDDTYTNHDSNVSIDGGAGDDSIRNGTYGISEIGANSTINAGEGNDYVDNFANNVTINGGAGNDSINNDGCDGDDGINFGVLMDGGDGDDNIGNNGGTDSTLLGGSGNDTIYNGAYNVLIEAGSGDDSIHNNGDNVTVNAGDDNDIVDNYGSNSTIDAGDGDDIVDNHGDRVFIDGGDGNDIINLWDGHNHTVTGGMGDDVINNNWNRGNVYIYGGGNDTIERFDINTCWLVIDGEYDIINEGEGTVTINVDGRGSITITEFWDAPKIVSSIDDVEPYNFIFNHEDGAVINGTDVNDYVGNWANNVTVRTGAGDDVINNWTYEERDDEGNLISRTTYDNVFIDAGDGNDYVENNGAHSTIDAGDGDDVINSWECNDLDDEGNLISRTTPDNVLITGGSGSDTISNSGSNSTIDAGEGDDRVGNYGGSSVLIDAGAGSDTIENFTNYQQWNEETQTHELVFPADNTTINAGDGDDQINNDGSNVLINAGDGNDFIENGASNVLIDAGAGNDTINLWGGHNHTVTGGEGDDLINNNWNRGNVYIYGGGNDTIERFDASTCWLVIDGEYDIINDGNGIVTINVDGRGSITLTECWDDPKIVSSLDDVEPYNVIYNDEDGVNINGTDGNDYVENNGANVAINTGGGNDVINNWERDDWDDEGNLIQHFSPDNVVIDAGDGNDYISNDGSNASIDAGSGDGTIDNNGANVTINAGDGDDHINNNGANVLIDAGKGDDFVWNGGNSSTILGGDGSDQIDNANARTNVYIDGGAGSDDIWNGASDTTVLGGDDDDSLGSGEGTANVLMDGGAGNDEFHNWANSSTMLGGAGDDYFAYNLGVNVLIDGGAGSDRIENNNPNVTMLGGVGNDEIVNASRGNNVQIDGGADDDNITNYGDNVTINGSDGDDTIIAPNNEGVTVDGGKGNDAIDAWGLNVVIRGGEGNDSVNMNNAYGWNGRYVFTYAPGDGNDVLAKGAVINLVDGATVDEITASGSNSIVKIGDGLIMVRDTAPEDVIIVYDDDYSAYMVNDIIFNDEPAQILGNASASGVQRITNYGESSTVFGGTGDDSITNEASNTFINAGGGNDSLVVGDYNITGVTAQGGGGDDTIYNNGKEALLLGGDGNDIINSENNSAFVTIDGGAGDDQIEVYGAINFLVSGGEGNDSVNVNSTWWNGRYIFTYAPGDGNDVVGKGAVINLVGGATVDEISADGSNSIVKIGDGSIIVKNTAPEDVIVVHDNNYFGYWIKDSIQNDEPSQVVGSPSATDIQRITNYGMSSTIFGGKGDDSLYNEASNAFISAGAGDDYLQIGDYNITGVTAHGGGGDDVIFNNGKNALIFGEDGNDTITSEGGSENVTIFGGSGDDQIEVQGIDYVVRGGEGNDSVNVNGSNGTEFIFEYSPGHGNDVVNKNAIISLLDGAEISESVTSGSDLVLKFADGGSITIIDGANSSPTIVRPAADGSDPYEELMGYEEINNSQGSQLITIGNSVKRKSKVTNDADNTTIRGGKGNDSVTNRADNVSIELEGGNNYVDSNGSNYTIKLGDGDDTVYALSNDNKDNYIDLGGGKNFVSNNGKNTTIVGGNYGNTVETCPNAVNNDITGGNSGDDIHTNGKGSHVEGRGKNDTLTNGDGYDAGNDIRQKREEIAQEAEKAYNEFNDALRKDFEEDPRIKDILENGANSEYLKGYTPEERETISEYYRDIFDAMRNGKKFIDAVKDVRKYFENMGKLHQVQKEIENLEWVIDRRAARSKKFARFATGENIYINGDQYDRQTRKLGREYKNKIRTKNALKKAMKKVPGLDNVIEGFEFIEAAHNAYKNPSSENMDKLVLEGVDFATSFIPIPGVDMLAGALLKTGYMMYRHGDVDVGSTFMNNIIGISSDNYIPKTRLKAMLRLSTLNAPKSYEELEEAYFNNKDFGIINGGADSDMMLNNKFDNMLLYGDTGNDIIKNYNSSNVTVYGGEGSDVISNLNSPNVTVYGGEGNDYILNNYSSNVSINTGDGNNSVSVYDSANVTVTTGDGDNSVENFGKNVSIGAGAGSDSITNVGARVSINAGEGNNKIDSTGDWTTIEAGGSSNYIYAAGNNVLVNVGDGGNFIETRDNLNATLLTGSGSDYIENYGDFGIISAGGGSDYIENVGDSNIFDMGAGDDLVDIVGNSNSIDGGEGNDLLWIYEGTDNTVRGGNGNDSIVNEGERTLFEYTAGSDIIEGFNESSTVRIGDGTGDYSSVATDDGDIVITTDDGQLILIGAASLPTVNIAGNELLEDGVIKLTEDDDYYTNTEGGVKILALGGNDTITNYGNNVTVDAGAGNDQVINNGKNVFINAAKTITNNNSGTFVTIRGGAGNDGIENYGDNANITGGDGDDFVWNNGGKSSIIDGGDGSDQIDNSGDGSTLLGGDGNDFINNSGVSSTIDGGAGNDYINNVVDNVTIDGGEGNDTITNRDGDNVLINTGDGDNTVKNGYASYYRSSDTWGFFGNNTTIIGGDGNDVIENLGAYVIVRAGGGSDTLYTEAPNALLDGGDGNDKISNRGSGSIILGGDGSTILGGEGNDTITNDGDGSFIDAGDGNDYIENGDLYYDSNYNTSNGISSTILGGEGSDTISNYGKSSIIDGSEGSDTIRNDGDDSTVLGGADNDTIDNRGSNVIIDGGAGDDFITNNGVGSTIVGGEGDDFIRNDGAVSIIDGGEGDDTINSRSGEYVIIDAGAGSDDITNDGEKASINGGADNDSITNDGEGSTIDGGAGDDLIISRAQNALLDGSEGSDLIFNGYYPRYTNGNAAYYKADNTGDGSTIDGGAGDDYIYNQGASVLISGGDGNDYIKNNGDNVTIIGGAGNDSILGGYANNVTFIFNGDGSDTIYGFNATSKLIIGDGTATYSRITRADGSIVINSGEGSVILYGAATLPSVNIEGVRETNYAWQVDGTTVTYGDDIETVLTLSGLRSGLMVNELGYIDGIHYGGGDTVSLDGNVLSTSKVTVTGNVTLAFRNDVSTEAHDETAWTVSSTTATLKAIKSAYYTLANDGKSITYKPAVSGATLATVRGIVSGTKVNDDGTIDGISVDVGAKLLTLTADVLNNADVTVSGTGNYKLALAKDIPPVFSDPIWNVSGTTATYAADKTASYSVSTDGKTINYERAGAVELVKLSGLKSGLTVNDGDTIDGIIFSTNDAGEDVIILTADVLGTSKVTITGDYKLELDSAVPTEAQPVIDCTVSGTTTKTATVKKFDEAYYTLATTGKSISYTSATRETTVATVSNLSNSAGEGDISVDGSVITVSDNALDPKKKVTVSSAGNYTLKLADDVTASETTDPEWVVEDGTATYAKAISAGYICDDKTITHTDDTSDVLATVKGLNVNATTDDISVEGDVITVSDNALDPTKNVTVSGGYKLKLADDVTVPELTDDNDWDISGTTAKFSGVIGAGYVCDGKSITYADETRKLLATISNLNSSVSENDFSVSGETITLKANALGTKAVTVTGDYKLALDSDVPTEATDGTVWNVSSTTATLKEAQTAYYTCDGDNVTYKPAVTSKTLATVKGVKSGLKAETFAEAVTINEKVITLGAEALGTAKVSITGNNGYALAIADDVPTEATPEMFWTVSGTKATLKSKYYTLAEDGKSITYDATTTLATISGIKSGLKVVDGNIAGISVDDINTNTITLTANVLGTANVTVSEGYSLALDGVTEPEETGPVWSITGNTTKTATLKNTVNQAGFKLDDEATTAVYSKTGTTTLVTVSGLNSDVTADEGNIDGISVDGDFITLKENVLGNSKVTVKEKGYTFKLDGVTISKVTDETAWDISGTTAKFSGVICAGYDLSNDGRSITYVDETTKLLATISGLKSGLKVVDGTIDGITVEGDVITLNEDVLGTSKVSVKENGYTLAIADTVPTKDQPGTFWTVSGTKATLKSKYYACDGKSITYDATTTLATISGIKSGLKAEDLDEAISIDGKVITLTASVLGNADVTISGNGYSLALAADVITSEPASVDTWTVSGTTATYKRVTPAYYNLVNGKVTCEKETATTLATVKGIRSGLTDEDFKAITIDGKVITLTADVLGTANVTVTGDYKLALDGDVPTTTTDGTVWSVSGTTATLKAAQTAYYTLDDGKVTCTPAKVGNVLATVKGIKSGLKAIDGNIDGITINDDVITLGAEALGTSNVSISGNGGYKLALNNGVTISELSNVNHTFDAKKDTLTVKGNISEGYNCDGKTITYSAAKIGTTLATVSGLNSGDIERDDTNKIISLKADALGTNKISISGNGGYILDISDDFAPAIDQDTITTTKSSTTLTIKGNISAGHTLSADGKSITYSAAKTGTTLATVSGLDKNFTTDDVIISGKTITLKEDALGTTKVTVTGNYTLKLDDNIAQAPTESTAWSVSGTTATFKETLTDYYTATDTAVTYNKATTGETLATIKGIKSGLKAIDGNIDGITVEDNDITLNANALGTTNVSITGNYNLKLDSDVNTDSKARDYWTTSGTTATYKNGSPAYYKLANNAITYTKESSKTLATVNGLIKDVKTDDLSINGNVITLKATAFGTTNVSVSKGYTLKLDDNIAQAPTESTAWTVSGTTATFKETKSDYYDLDNTKVTYRKETSTTLATVKGIKSGLSDEEFVNGISISGKVITLKADVLGNANVTVTGNYTLALDGVPTTAEDTGNGIAWNGGKLNEITNAYYQPAANGKSITYKKETVGKNLATVTGLKSKVTLGADNFDEDTSTIKLGGDDLNTKVTVTSDSWSFDFDDSYSKATISGSAKDDTITAAGDNLSIGGGAGADVITATGANVSINGGGGNDNVTFGNGNYTFFYASGDGNDVIADFTSDDKIKLTTASVTADVDFDGSDAIVTITKGRTTGTITLTGAANETISIVDSRGKITDYTSTVTNDNVNSFWFDESNYSAATIDDLTKDTEYFSPGNIDAAEATALTEQSDQLTATHSDDK